MKRYALTAIGRDTPGIVAAVTKALFEHDCNIEDSSMTILEDEFAIILIMSIPENMDISALSKDLKAVEKSVGLTIHLKEIPKRSAARGQASNYIITLHGADKAGIVYRCADALSRFGINITDLETKVIGDEKKVYIMVMEVYSPKEADLKNLEKDLSRLGESLGVTIKIKPIEAYEPL
jgi:glycine cleavage system transcriptional repressor